MFTSTLNTDTQGVMGVTRGGQVCYHGDSSLPLVIISNYIMFTSTLNTDTQGVMGVTRGGQVVTIKIKKEGLVSYVRDTAKKTNQANRLEKAISC